ncbi:AP-3 complex subunit delta-1-like isoform X1, partial [Arapaima gigas]
ASCILQLVKFIQKLQQKEVDVVEEVTALFAGELNPVAPKAQKKVPVPEGLHLDSWINEPPSESESEDEKSVAVFTEEESHRAHPHHAEVDEKELARRREQRKQEQANNPFYIKASPTSQKGYQDITGVEHIPVVQIDLSVPLKVPGMSTSDKYLKLEEERRQRERTERSKKEKKKKKREKRRRLSQRHDSGPESEEDIAPAHMVDIVTEEMPENALPSDDDDKDPNDPYRALDVDLDKLGAGSPCRPLADSEKLPVRAHRPINVLKSPLEDGGVQEVSQESKKKSKKEKREKEGERKKSKDEKKKKKHHRSWKETEESFPTEELVHSAGNTEVEGQPAAAPAEASDLDFWLSGAPVPSKNQETSEAAPHSLPEGSTDAGPSSEPEDTKCSKHKKKKQKKEKDEKEGKKKKKRRQHDCSADRAETGSVQNGTVEEEPLPPMSNYSLLAENSYIKMACEIQGNLQDGSQVVVSVIFENKSTSFLKSMEFSVLDSLNAKLQRPEGAGPHDSLTVPFQLPPGVSNEARFVFSVQSIIMPQKLKGTLTFIVKSEDGSTHEKLDFKLHFTCSSYLITTPCYSDAFTKLLESTDLKGISVRLQGISLPFHHLLAKICFHHHFSVVERIDSCASLYSRSIQGHHVCLLVKYVDQTVTIDSKCDESSLLGNVLDEVKKTICQS